MYNPRYFSIAEGGYHRRKLCRQGGVIQAGHTFSYEYSGSLHRRENEFIEEETI